MRLSPWRTLLMAIDATCVAVAMLIAAVLLYDGDFESMWRVLRLAIALTAVVVPLCHYVAGLYSRIWQYANAEAVIAIGAGVTGSLVVSCVVGRLLGIGVPMSVWYVTWLTSIIAVGATRLGWRLIRPILSRGQHGDARRILIYGAGPEGAILPVALERLYGNSYYTVGYLDDDAGNSGLIIGSARVLGTLDDLPRVVAQQRVDEVVITTPFGDRDRMRGIFDQCRKANVRARSLPPFLEMIEDTCIAPREVFAEDLLEREWSPADVELRENYLADKTVLVTGAGGSIGSELCRQICQYEPRRLLLLGRGENRIHWVYLHLRKRFPNLEIIPIIQNVTVESGMREVFTTYRPDIVFHAAAHKHVYLMERVPVEAVRNNVIGTRIVSDLAQEYGVQRFIFISTDKAVSPTAVMGATKRVGELLLTCRPQAGTDFICVRFGNVLGSDGSVLEIFRRQWQRREPLTVTDPEATRFFMSIPEASFLVLQAGALGKHGETFILDMGRPISILKLAQEFILLHGGNPYNPESIQFTGLCSGEKMHEALTYSDETLMPTADERILRVRPNGHRIDAEMLHRQIERLEACVASENEEDVCETLSAITGGVVRPTMARATSA